mgnify:CR=1 FL=1
MKRIFLILLALASFANAAISTATKPHVIDSAATPKVSYVDDNDEALLDKLQEVIDTVNLHNVGGAVTGSAYSSTGDIRQTIDSDNNGTNAWFITQNGATDTIYRVSEGGAWRAFGNGVGTKLTLSDSILAATLRISGLTASRLMATNAGSTAASVADLTAWIAGTSNQITSTSNGSGGVTLSIPNGFTLPSASPTFTAVTTTGQSTLAGITMDGGTSGQGRIYTTSTVGLALQALAGSSYDFSLLGTSGIGSYVMRVPTGTTTAEFPNAVSLSYLSSGRVPVASTGGLITQDNLYWDATNDRLGIGSGAASPSYTLDILRSITGSAVVARLGNSESTDPASHARLEISTTGASAGDPFVLFNNNVVNWSTGLDNSDGDAFVITPAATPGGATNGLRISTAGAVTVPGTLGVTGAATFSSTITTPLTASLPVFTNGSSALTTNAVTGTGNVMMSASPTTTGTLTGAAANFSGQVLAGTLRSGGGEAFVYGDTSFVMSGTTGWTTTPSMSVHATKVGNLVVMRFGAMTATSNTAGMTITGIPVGWRPSFTESFAVPFTTDNGLESIGGVYCAVNISGDMTCYRTGSWTSSGTKGFANEFTVAYQMQ